MLVNLNIKFFAKSAIRAVFSDAEVCHRSRSAPLGDELPTTLRPALCLCLSSSIIFYVQNVLGYLRHAYYYAEHFG